MSGRDIIVRRVGSHLEPVNAAEAEALGAYPEGRDLWVQIRRRRSLVHHDLYWARLKAVIDSGATRYHSVHSLHTAIKYEMGMVRPVVTLSGKLRLEPDSIAFDAMDQSEFNTFFAQAMELIKQSYNIDPEELLK